MISVFTFSVANLRFKHQKGFFDITHSLKCQYLINVKCSEGSELQNDVDEPSKGPADEESCKNYQNKFLVKYKDKMVVEL